MQAPKKFKSLYISSHAPTIVAIADVIRAADPKEVEWATYKLKYDVPQVVDHKEVQFNP
jgi:hypothetical protein